jgi:hypothetical protein
MTHPENMTIVTWFGTVAVLVALPIVILLAIGQVEDKLEVAEIAGTRVPPVSCQEDEVIWWTGPDTLGCVHFEEVR